MNEVVTEHPDRELRVILDNLNKHKPKHDRWLARYQNVHLPFTPTHASWLNQIEYWFSILSRRALRGASFTSPQQVREAIDRSLQRTTTMRRRSNGLNGTCGTSTPPILR